MTSQLSWEPTASIQALKARQSIIQRIRQFFIQKNYLEVETPLMADFGVTDVYIEHLEVDCMGVKKALQTSPEYHMKRLLAAGSGPIFQISRAFRNDESGRWHRPEFTMLEWYGVGYDIDAMLCEIGELLQLVLTHEPLQVLTYQALFERYCDWNPFDANQNITQLQAVLSRFNLARTLSQNEVTLDACLFLLMSHVVEPHLAKDFPSTPIAVIDFPPSQAALAQIHNGVAKRFELYFQGVELANGFDELRDSNEQLERFHTDNQCRRLKNLPEKAIDVRLIRALECGIPPCVGVALGIDRLVTLALGYQDIQYAIAFND